jgi:SAM-dependent methyltransferase
MDLKCVICGAVPLKNTGDAWKCGPCGTSFPLVDGVARFVGNEAYSRSFGFQWNRFARTQLDSANGTTRSRDTFLEKTGWTLDDLRGKRVLDAGCGMGRFAEVCAGAGAEVHAVDLSTAVGAAWHNLGHRPNVRLYQADIMKLPFPPGSFDFIYSIGVLHHTPDTRAAFLKLPPLLKPGGAIVIWVYSTELRYTVGGELLRKVTTRLPKPWLLLLSRLAVPLYYVHRVPRLRAITCKSLPTSMDPDPQWRWLDTFDWYSPTYQWKHTYEEVEAWSREAGLTEVRRGGVPISVQGVRPVEDASPLEGVLAKGEVGGRE